MGGCSFITSNGETEETATEKIRNKGKYNRGDKSGQRKITAEQRRAMRKSKGCTRGDKEGNKEMKNEVING